jgi:ribosomal protein S18 acetylase RimI-like enzyme
MSNVTIELARDGDLAEILRTFERRTLGLGRRLYETFASTAAQRGATALKALTSPENTSSQAFHRRMGFTDQTEVPDYAGSGRTRIVMRRPLPL